jgi:hypothetical protein
MALTAVAAGISAVSSLVGGIGAFMGFQQQAQVANFNKQIALDNASRAEKRAQIEQQEQDMATLDLLGQQEAIQGASGLAIGGGSQVATRRAARQLGRLDALNIRQAGAIESYNYKTQAVNFGAQASAAKLSGATSLIGGFLGAGSSLVDSGTSVRNPNRYKNFKPTTLRGLE